MIANLKRYKDIEHAKLFGWQTWLGRKPWGENLHGALLILWTLIGAGGSFYLGLTFVTSLHPDTQMTGSLLWAFVFTLGMMVGLGVWAWAITRKWARWAAGRTEMEACAQEFERHLQMHPEDQSLVEEIWTLIKERRLSSRWVDGLTHDLQNANTPIATTSGPASTRLEGIFSKPNVVHIAESDHAEIYNDKEPTPSERKDFVF